MSERPFNLFLATALGVTLLAGCAAEKPVKQAADEPANRFVGTDPVYALLMRRGDGQWMFTSVNGNYSDSEEGWPVRLNDLSPAFDVRRAECEPLQYRENDRCNPLNPFRDKSLGVVGKIVETGISAGTGGTISGFSRSYSTEFDQLAFNAAVDQALLLTGLDDHRVTFLNGLNSVEGKAAAQAMEIEAFKVRMLEQYEQDKEQNIKIDARISGLVQYYSDDLDPAKFVKILTEPAQSVMSSETAEVSVLPCDASACMEQLNAIIADLDRQHAARLATLRAELQSRTDAYVVDCSATQHAGYHFRLHCPEKLARNQDGIIVLPVEVEILSRDFEHLFPEFTRENSELAAAVRQGRLVLKNRTGDFVDVQSVSIYYNSQINTVSDIGARLDLAPYQYTEVPLAEYSSPDIDIASLHTNMTPDKASRSHFSFGLAIQYSLRDRDAVETLYGANNFNLQCTIESRLRPGSCSSALAKDTEAAANAPERRLYPMISTR